MRRDVCLRCGTTMKHEDSEDLDNDHTVDRFWCPECETHRRRG